MAEAQRETNGEDEKIKKIRELGSQLKELREAQGITLEHASEATKIQKKYIAAIEEGELASMPKGPYCRSFLRQYCALLNAPDMWGKYDPLTKSASAAPSELKVHRNEPDMSVTPGVFRRSPRFWIYLLVAASLAAAVWVTLRYRGEISLSATSPLRGGTAPIVREQQERSDSPSDEGQEPATQASSDAAAPASVDLSWMDGKPPASQTAAQEQTQSAAPAPQNEPVLTLTVRANSWMRISIGQNVLYEGTMKPGEKKEFRVDGPTPLRLRCGKPSATDAAWFGSSPKALGGGSNPVTLYYWSDGAVTSAETR